MANATDISDDYQFNAASPVMASGVDVDKLLSGDEAALAQAKSLGLPVPSGPSPNGANPAVGSNTPSPAGTSAMQQTPTRLMPDTASLPKGTPGIVPNAITPGGAPATAPSSLDGMGSALAQSQQPATNAPAAPGETTASPTVPATVTPSGTAEDPNQQGIERAGEMAESFSQKLAAQPTLAQELAPIQAKRTLPPQEFDPAHPEYRPTAGRRILRGLVGVGMGVAEHGIRGGLLGGLDPEAVGGTPYSAPTRQFSVAAQQQQAQQAALDKQQAVTTEAYKEDTGRAKDVITSINDIGKNYAAGETAKSREDIAGARQDTARVAQQLADIKQQVADYQAQGKTPTSYEATVAAAHLEKDPVKAKALEAAAREMANTEVRKFQFAAGNGGSPFRQSAIDDATQKVKTIKDSYTYDPLANMYKANTGIDSGDLTPSQFWDKQNQVVDDLNKGLAQKKLAPLTGVQFGPSDFEKSKPAGREAQRKAAQQAANRPKPPTPTTPAPRGAVDMALGPDNQYHYRDAGKKDLGVVK